MAELNDINRSGELTGIKLGGTGVEHEVATKGWVNEPRELMKLKGDLPTIIMEVESADTRHMIVKFFDTIITRVK